MVALEEEEDEEKLPREAVVVVMVASEEEEDKEEMPREAVVVVMVASEEDKEEMPREAEEEEDEEEIAPRGRGPLGVRRPAFKRRGVISEGGSEVRLIPHDKYEGIFIAIGEENFLVTKNLVPGVSVSNEKEFFIPNEDGTIVEYRVWNPSQSEFAAVISGGLKHIYLKPGAQVLYLCAGSRINVSHVSDIVRPTGCVYAVEFSPKSYRDLVKMAEKRANVIPIREDAADPVKYRMLVNMVDVLFSDIAKPDQARILGLNATYYLKNKGQFMISVKVSSINPLVAEETNVNELVQLRETVFRSEVEKLREEGFKPLKQMTLGTYNPGHAYVVGRYRKPKKRSQNAAEA